MFNCTVFYNVLGMWDEQQNKENEKEDLKNHNVQLHGFVMSS